MEYLCFVVFVHFVLFSFFFNDSAMEAFLSSERLFPSHIMTSKWQHIAQNETAEATAYSTLMSRSWHAAHLHPRSG